MKKLLLFILLATIVVACKKDKSEPNSHIMDVSYTLSVENKSGEDLFGDKVDNKWSASDIAVLYLDGDVKKEPPMWGHIGEDGSYGHRVCPKKDDLNRTRISFYASDFMTKTNMADMLTCTSEIHWPNGEVNVIKCTVHHPGPGYLFMEEIYIDGELLWSKKMRRHLQEGDVKYTADYPRDFIKVVTETGSTIKLWEDSNF